MADGTDAAALPPAVYDAFADRLPFLLVGHGRRRAAWVPRPLRSAPYFNVSVAGGLRRLVRRLTRQIDIPAAERRRASANLWMVPADNPHFVGRKQVLAEIREGLDRTGRIRVVGTGGVGKTQTAIRYAEEHRGAYKAALWARADSPESLRLAFDTFAERLGVAAPEMNDRGATHAAVTEWMRTHEGWLLVLDDMGPWPRGEGPVWDLVPARGPGHVLVTSRVADAGIGMAVVSLGGMSRDEATLLLLRRAGRLASEDILTDADAASREAAGVLADALNGLPLALEIAARYVAETHCGFERYLERLQGAGAERRVEGIVRLSFERLASHDHGAADLLRLCSVLAADPIPEGVLSAGATAIGEALGMAAVDPVLRAEALANAERTALLRLDREAGTFTMHPAVQAGVQGSMSRDELRRWVERSADLLAVAFPNPRFENWRLCRQLLPHALVCTSGVPLYDVESVGTGRLLANLGRFLSEAGDYPGARAMEERAVRTFQRVLGDEHPVTLTSISNLAGTLRNLGDLAGARSLQEQVLGSRRRVSGDDHPDTLVVMNNLAQTLNRLGDRPGARAIQEEVLRVSRRVAGEDDTLTLTAANNLAMTVFHLDDQAAAREMLEHVLATRRRIWGDEHPDTLLAMNNLATILYHLGNLTGARSLLEQALRGRERVLGNEHPYTLSTRANLARVDQDLADAAGDSESAISRLPGPPRA